MAETGTELRAVGPLELLDGALLAVRQGGASPFLRALLAGAPLALVAVAIYYVERVEGARGLRPLLAGLLVLGWWSRSILLGVVARDYALAIRSTLPVSDAPPALAERLCTASVIGLGLWVWLWPLAGAALLAPFAVAAILPFAALRGAVAPSWLARSACARERGFAALGQAFDDTAGVRGAFLIVELLALFGLIGLFSNLYALLGFGLLLGNSILGLEVAFVSSFLSPDNTFVLLLVAALALLLFEPLRAAISAQAFVDARSRRDGADLHAAVDAAIARAGRRVARAGESEVAAVLLLACTLTATGVRAQPTADAPDAPRPSAQSDELVRQDLSEILGRHEFREFAPSDSRTLSDLFERFFAWLGEHLPDADPGTRSQPLQLPDLSPWVLMALALLVLSLLVLYASSQRRTLRAAKGQLADDRDGSTPTRPASWLDEAARLAEAGDARGALRALYLATLATLDRKRLIEFEPSKTNGQYIRGMPRGEVRKLFAAFTRVFDSKWYGHESATLEDYAKCRGLVERIGMELPP